MNEKYAHVLAILKGAAEDISSILTEKDDELHKLRIVSALTRLHDQTAQMSGHGRSIIQSDGRPPKVQATMIKGAAQKALLQRKNFQAPTIDMTARVDAFRNRVEEAYARFPTMEVSDILGGFEEIVVRGVARKAKMPGVSDVSPERVDKAFVEQVKAAVLANNDRELHSKAEKDNARQRDLEEQIKEAKAEADKQKASELKASGTSQPKAIEAETNAVTDAKPKTNSGQFKKK